MAVRYAKAWCLSYKCNPMRVRGWGLAREHKGLSGAELEMFDLKNADADDLLEALLGGVDALPGDVLPDDILDQDPVPAAPGQGAKRPAPKTDSAAKLA